MRLVPFLLFIGFCIPAAVATGESRSIAAQQAICTAVESPQRDAKNVARDIYRHPIETLTFFGVTPAQTVVEAWPGGGWYAEILAPLLRDRGKYIAAAPPGKAHDALVALFAKDTKRFGKAVVTTLQIGKASDIAPAGSADVVLTFRNVHNFLKAGDAASARFFADCYRALKPGGVLGVVDHRLPENADSSLQIPSGYIKRSTIVRLAIAAGFKFDGESAVNANPRDDHMHPKGVWTLPPSYALGDVDRAKYQAIGESDRLTLRFVKPR
ncbi:MAG: methyltransferase domain-containing protein [Methylovirgula sp.]|uniref:class I SAM-dependent methyltransferase n=1 Tax=Methylovirgula sp. TaxID=1978224 RepID=UPI0030761551